MGQYLTRLDDDVVAAGSKGYLKAHFTFSGEWVNTVKYALFAAGYENIPVELKEPEHECLVPLQMLKHQRIRVSAFGMNGNRTVITSTHVHLDIEQGGYFPSPDFPPAPPLELYEQIMQELAYIKKYSVNGGCVSPEIIEGKNTDDEYTLIIQDATGSWETANLKGRAGPAGAGQSAYQLAQEMGFTGSKEEWLDSLKGDPGPIFIPSVSEDGILSWTNDAGLDNPEPVNIKGGAGDVTIVETTNDEILQLWNKQL